MSPKKPPTKEQEILKLYDLWSVNGDGNLASFFDYVYNNKWMVIPPDRNINPCMWMTSLIRG